MIDENTAIASTAQPGSIEGGATTAAPSQQPAPEAAQKTQEQPKRRSIREHLHESDAAHELASVAGKASGEARRAAATVSGSPGDTRTQTPPTDGGKTQIAQPQDGAIFSPPDRWPAARKELFAKQPPEVQEAWLAQGRDWEAGFTKKSQELSDKARVADGVRGLITDGHRQAMQRAGINDEVGAFKYLLNQHDFYKSDPVQYVATIMRHANIDPRIFIQGAAGSPQHPGQQQVQQLPPVHPGLMQEIGTLRETLQHLSARENERIASAVDATIDAFETAKTADGQPAHPHFARVGEAMIEIVRTDPRLRGMPDGPEKLQRAYDLAVWDNPEIRQEIIDAETKRRIAAQQPQNPAQAPKAPTSIKPATGAPDATRGHKKRSIRDHLAATDKQFGY
jgi:hypothetical protein